MFSTWQDDSSPEKFKILISEGEIKTNGSKVSILMIVHYYSNITHGKPLTNIINLIVSKAIFAGAARRQSPLPDP